MYTREKERESENVFTNVMFEDHGFLKKLFDILN